MKRQGKWETQDIESGREELKEKIDFKERRKLKARREGEQSPWFGLGMFGLIGWSVVVPTLVGILTGTWLDHRWPSQFSWTLTLLLIGVIVGFANAWYWMQRESNNTRQ